MKFVLPALFIGSAAAFDATMTFSLKKKGPKKAAKKVSV